MGLWISQFPLLLIIPLCRFNIQRFDLWSLWSLCFDTWLPWGMLQGHLNTGVSSYHWLECSADVFRSNWLAVLVKVYLYVSPVSLSLENILSTDLCFLILIQPLISLTATVHITCHFPAFYLQPICVWNLNPVSCEQHIIGLFKLPCCWLPCLIHLPSLPFPLASKGFKQEVRALGLFSGKIYSFGYSFVSQILRNIIKVFKNPYYKHLSPQFFLWIVLGSLSLDLTGNAAQMNLMLKWVWTNACGEDHSENAPTIQSNKDRLWEWGFWRRLVWVGVVS